MKFIDKTKHKDEGEAIVFQFLTRFHERTGAYPTDLYNAFGKEIDDGHGHTIFRKRLLNEVLIPEQRGLCCYCLRNLDECSQVTIEHIMRNHAADKYELDKYRRIKSTELDPLPHSNDFLSLNPKTFPPHPHSIAYQNLVVSCDGNLLKENTKPVCCNLKRKNRFIPPLPLFNDIESTFVYYQDGLAEWTEDPKPPESQENAVRILGLNNTVLKMARRIWFFCKDNSMDPNVLTRNEIINSMMGSFDPAAVTKRETDMLLNFKTDKYWNLFLEYRAFRNVKHC